jgi:hypothetical protein
MVADYHLAFASEGPEPAFGCLLLRRVRRLRGKMQLGFFADLHSYLRTKRADLRSYLQTYADCGPMETKICEHVRRLRGRFSIEKRKVCEISKIAGEACIGCRLINS